MTITRAQLSGPRSLPLIGNLHQVDLSKLHQNIEAWAEEYGPVFKMQMGTESFTVVTDPATIQGILRDRPDGFRRMAKMDTVLREVGVSGVFNAEGKDWVVHRRIVAKGLDMRHQQRFFPAIIKCVERLHKRWIVAAEKGEAIDLQRDLMRFTVDVTTALAFGYEMNTLEQETNRIQEHLEHIFPTIFSRINSPIPYWRYFKLKKDRRLDRSLKVVYELIDEFIAQARRELKYNSDLRENPSNFLHGLLLAAEEEEAITDNDVRGNVMTMLLAGEDTTAHSVGWTVFQLCQHPDVQEKLHEEAVAVLRDHSWSQYYKENQKMEYTEATALEGMRLKPVAPIMLMEPIEDREVNGYLFEKGTSMMLETRYGSMQCTHFKDAGEFIPERWLKTRNKEDAHNTDAYLPFGSGPRYCPGKNLAMLEMKLLISMLMKSFSVKLDPACPDVEEKLAFTMMPERLHVVLELRA